MILVALGANLPGRFGDPAATLAAALQALKDRGIAVVSASRIWISAPVPVSDQPDFCNAVARVETTLDPRGLIAALHDIERDFGRVRVERNEARVLDLDLIAYNGEVMAGALTLPHPWLQERAFVLLPLRDIAPAWTHPVSGAALDTLIAALPPQEIRAGGKLI